MAYDMFLKIDSLPGESADKTHGGEIDVLSWDLGMSQSGTMHVGTGGGAGRVSMGDLHITKYTDKASPMLMLAACTGRHFKEAVLTIRKAGDKPLEYNVFTLKDVLVSSVAAGGAGGDKGERLTEEIALNFASIKQSYTPQKADGSADASIEATFNVAQNCAE